jgi:hypothetical protein
MALNKDRRIDQNVMYCARSAWGMRRQESIQLCDQLTRLTSNLFLLISVVFSSAIRRIMNLHELIRMSLLRPILMLSVSSFRLK